MAGTVAGSMRRFRLWEDEDAQGQASRAMPWRVGMGLSVLAPVAILAQVEGAATQTAGPYASLVPPAAAYSATRTLVAPFCPGDASRLG